MLPRVLLSAVVWLAPILVCDAATLSTPVLAFRSSPSPRASYVITELLPAALRRLRGGADDDSELDELDEDLEGGSDEGGEEAGAESTLDNPFLSGGGGAASGLGMEEMKKSLQDPAAIQQALKELQDPATQERFRQMMEDPAFLESMKSYAEQIAKDPMFEQLKEQAEKMMSDPAFMEEIQKAIADPNLIASLAGLSGAAGGLGGASEDDDDDE